ncbi:hypothetical protein AB0I10_37905, partial [Streptomyces sp. NPDC050636]|uniref:hypothetical protein n=1 Tax=Streptomyces sp. NPDC050636 TaxID=3154510 RepID=UPI00344734C9
MPKSSENLYGAQPDGPTRRHTFLSEDEDRAIVEWNQQLVFWRGVLSGLPDQLDLPVDRPRPVRASFRGGSVP